MKKFKVGDKVICVKATGFLVAGETYTVKGLHLYDGSGDLLGITVVECVNKEGYVSYGVDRFEKIDTSHSVDISENDLNSLIDAVISLDYYSEGTYINLQSVNSVLYKLENQFNEKNK
tara:strand:- start:247 stop:600 length:354 start_codon:yes stop_codon:yes gene_type:complete